MIGRWVNDADLKESDLPCEPAGHGVIATGTIESCKEFWRTFIRNTVVMDWIGNGYQLLWSEVPPASKEMPNAPSAHEQREFISWAIYCRDVGGPRRHIVGTGREAFGGDPLGDGAHARNIELPADVKHAIC